MVQGLRFGAVAKKLYVLARSLVDLLARMFSVLVTLAPCPCTVACPEMRRWRFSGGVPGVAAGARLGCDAIYEPLHNKLHEPVGLRTGRGPGRQIASLAGMGRALKR